MDAVKTIDCPNCGTPNEESYETFYNYFKRNDMLGYVSPDKKRSNFLVINCVKCSQWILKDKPFTYRTFHESLWAVIKTNENVLLYCEDCKTTLEKIDCIDRDDKGHGKCCVYCPLCEYQEILPYNSSKDFRFSFTGFIPKDLKSKAISVNQKKEDEVL